jgi:DNA-binding transcriptional LysR family regulator
VASHGRQIRALEQELGCALLERTTRAVRLTPAGQQLYEDTPGVLAAAAAATRRVHEAARGVERLVVGFAPGLRVSGVVRAFTQAHPGVDVELVHLNWYEQAEAIRDGRADVGYLRGTFTGDGIRTVPVGSEPRVACMPASHALASRRRLTEADLEGQAMLDTEARRVATIEEKFELVAAGHGIVVVPRSVARYYARPGLVHRTVTDAPPYQLCLAVASSRRQQHLEDFLTAAAQALADPRS